MVSQQENSGCLERTSAVSLSYSHLTSEREPVGTAQVHSDLNKLSALSGYAIDGHKLALTFPIGVIRGAVGWPEVSDYFISWSCSLILCTSRFLFVYCVENKFPLHA